MMRHNEYVDACARSELKDMPARLRNLSTGEIGTVVQCTGMEKAEGFLVRVGDEVTSWYPEEVQEVEGEK